MDTHINGVCPEYIFKERRPLEGNIEEVNTYRRENFRPITKSEFDKAISDYTEVANRLDYVINWSSSNNRNYIEDYRINVGGRSKSLHSYIINDIGRIRQSDPNSMLVVLPKHPTNPLIPSYSATLPNFSDASKLIDVDVIHVHSSEIEYFNENEVKILGGKWEIENGSENYYWTFRKDKIVLSFPNNVKGNVQYLDYDYYIYDFKTIPCYILGGVIVDGIDGEFYLSDFFGASSWGDKAIGQEGDLQICEVRFTHPRHWRIKIPCDNQMNGCMVNQEGRYTILNHQDGSENNCPRCKGSGYIMDTTPLGTLIIDPKDGVLSESGKFSEPEGFVSPPSEILKHSAERVEYYMMKMKQSLNILDQNMTSQSGTSKSYDVKHKEATIYRIVNDMYLLENNVFNSIDEIRNGNGDIQHLMPSDYKIKNSNDLLIEINEAKANKMPYHIILDLVKKYYLKKLGDNKRNNLIIDFLSLNDKLFAFGLEDLQLAKALFGTDISAKDIVIHNLGFQILDNITKGLDDMDDVNISDLKTKFDLAIAPYIQTTTVI